MSARAKIENLTHTWYGFAVFSAAARLVDKFLEDGFGIGKFIWAGIGLLFTLLFMSFVSRRLVNKGRLTRWILLAVSGLSTVFGAYGAVKSSWTFVHAWELHFIVEAASSAITAWIMAKSFRVLTDASVKQYFS